MSSGMIRLHRELCLIRLFLESRGERLGVLKMDEACSAKSCPVQSHKRDW
ncbi:hypothetical protein PAMP_002231 [Pampus punctatissimus]